MIALIPARSGSKRIPGKNTRLLAGHPLVAYTIATAIASGVFDQIWLCTDDQKTADLVEGLGASYFERQPAGDDQADIVWVREVLDALTDMDMRPETFAILRPTSPFRTVEMLKRAHRTFYNYLSADSLRAVEPVTQHPGKMWSWEGTGYPIKPLLSHVRPDGVPWHSSPTQSLPTYYVQNAALEMAWTRNVECFGTIHGQSVIPFFCEGHTGVDLNTERDWRDAEALLAAGAATLPAIPLPRVHAAAPAHDVPDPSGTVAG